jgi:RNase P subunit RPR2
MVINMRRTYTKAIAKERIEILLGLARRIYKKNPKLAKRYVKLARKVGMKCNVRIPKEERLFICKNCNMPLILGINCRVRVRSKGGTKTVVTCLECDSKRRYPALKEKVNPGKSFQ